MRKTGIRPKLQTLRNSVLPPQDLPVEEYGDDDPVISQVPPSQHFFGHLYSSASYL